MIRARRRLRQVGIVLLTVYLAVALGGAGVAWWRGLHQTRLDLVVPGAELIAVQHRGLSRQQLTYRLSAPGGRALLHQHLVAQGWQLDRVMHEEDVMVYRRSALDGLVYETVLVAYNRGVVAIEVLRCIHYIGCW